MQNTCLLNCVGQARGIRFSVTVASITDGELVGESERSSKANLGWPGQYYEAG